ncbi:hypothetical protein RND71_002299 [Anisodus tanguticus]|uniref:Protein SPIRAL1-like 1 n=1 Tax=Anisodus tanguticus TaxID=243964 RepID=A0AAE1VSY3_9SOLA|nr:hypothetical protein RND71_002299 [Anisodus tanguticus]
MGRGVSSGGGQSSLGYLFGDGEAPKSTTKRPQGVQSEAQPINKESSPKPVAAAPATKQVPAGIQSIRADGQNTGNFITDRPSTKIHAAPGGGSSLGYLFGGGSS